jgi:hypothetical protein
MKGAILVILITVLSVCMHYIFTILVWRLTCMSLTLLLGSTASQLS